jgi:hypothetical protein
LTPGAWKGSAYNQRISNGESPGVVTFNKQAWSLSNERRQGNTIHRVDTNPRINSPQIH